MRSSIDPKSRVTIPVDIYREHFTGVDSIYGVMARHHLILSNNEPFVGSYFHVYPITQSGENHRILIPEDRIIHGLSLHDYDKSKGYGLWVQEKVANGVKFLLFIGDEGARTYEAMRDSQNEFYKLMAKQQATLQK